MNKYLVFRCGKCIWKNTKSHELIGVEMAEDIDDVFEDIQQDILDDLKGMKDYRKHIGVNGIRFDVFGVKITVRIN